MSEIRGLTESHPVLGWGLVLGVVAIAGLPPLGIFMSEFLIVSSTFAREPLLAILLVFGLLVAFGALMLRLSEVAFGAPTGSTAPGRRPPTCRCLPIWRWCWPPASICRARWWPGSRPSRGCWGERCEARHGSSDLAAMIACRGRRPSRAAVQPARMARAVVRSHVRDAIWRQAVARHRRRRGDAARPVERRRGRAHGARRASAEIAASSACACPERPLSLRRRHAPAGAAAGAHHPRPLRARARRLARRPPLARPRPLGRAPAAGRAQADARRRRRLRLPSPPKARRCTRSPSARCTPASSSPAISASPPTARPSCGSRSGWATCTRASTA